MATHTWTHLMDGETDAVVVGVTVRVTLADADPEGEAEGLRDGTLAVGEGLPDREADPERETVGEKEDVTVGVGDLESVREVDTDLVMDRVVEVDPVNDEETAGAKATSDRRQCTRRGG
jgi:hypothetical protein